MGTSATLLGILFVAIALIVFLIMKVRLHAFFALIIACFFVGLSAGMPLNKIAPAIEAGIGGTLGFLAAILGLGTVLGKLLEVSGGAERLARTLINAMGKQRAGWAMMCVGFIAGIPVFFQVGFVLLIPLVFSVAKETGLSMVSIGIPLATSLMAVHCILPPHPAAMAITGTLGADVGRVIVYGLLVGFPAAIIGGVLWSSLISRSMDLVMPAHLKEARRIPDEELPGFGITLFTILLPLLIMVGKTIIELNFPKDAAFMPIVAFIGNPITALLISSLVAYFTLGLARGFDMKQLLSLTDQCFGPVAGILLVIGAGGAFNKVLIESGLGVEMAKVLNSLQLSPLILAWIVTAVMRFSVGSATVAMMTGAGVIMPIMKATPGLDPALVAVAIGAGAIGFSHVNDSGFWIVKEYFGLSLTDMFKAFTTATCIASFVALGCTVLLASVL